MYILAISDEIASFLMSIMMDDPNQVNFEQNNILQVPATVVFENECYSSPSALLALFLGTDLSSENLPNDPTRDNDDGLDNDDNENGLEGRQSRMCKHYDTFLLLTLL